MATGRQVTYTLRLNSNVSAILNQADKDAIRFDSTMWQLNKTLSAFGVGLGANYLMDAAKHWTQGAADYESAMLRVKNAADGAALGFKNQFFINKEVDDFKLKLQEAIDAYGSFLFKIKNAGISNDVQQRMYDNILTISKVSGIAQPEIDATVRNIGIMLGEGVLEARHLRALSYVHPQIVPFLADSLGLKSGEKDDFSKILKSDHDDNTASQKLSLLISGGKLTKMALPANIIVDALEKYRESIQDKLPETLNTVQSEINDLSNTLERFKNKLVLDNKNDLVGVFHNLTQGVHWLVEHEDGIIKVAETIGTVVKMYIEWRLAILALQAPAMIMGFVAQEQARLADTLAIYSGTATEAAISNEQLAASSRIVADVTVAQISNAEAEIVALEQQQISLNALSSSLAQVSTQMDLFTEAQIINTSSAERMGFALTELDGVMRVTANYMDTNITQGSLFTEVELEMTAATTGMTDALFIQNEQLAIRNRLMLEQAELAEIQAVNTASALAGNSRVLNPYSGMMSAGSFTSGVANVFIIGMAAELINGMMPQGNWSNNKMGLTDWLYGVSQVTNPWYWFDEKGKNGKDGGHGFGRVHDIALENASIQNFKDDFTKAFPAKYDFTTGRVQSPYVNPNGNEFYQLIKQIQTLNPDYDYEGNLGIKPDKSGKMHVSNVELYDLLQRHGTPLPYIGDERNWGGFTPYVSMDAKMAAEKGGSSGFNTDHLGKDTHRIRGNSSNYFTVNIETMNGVETLTIKADNGLGMSIDEVKEIAGDTFIHMLTDAIADSQALKDK